MWEESGRVCEGRCRPTCAMVVSVGRPAVVRMSAMMRGTDRRAEAFLTWSSEVKTRVTSALSLSAAGGRGEEGELAGGGPRSRRMVGEGCQVTYLSHRPTAVVAVVVAEVMESKDEPLTPEVTTAVGGGSGTMTRLAMGSSSARSEDCLVGKEGGAGGGGSAG